MKMTIRVVLAVLAGVGWAGCSSSSTVPDATAADALQVQEFSTPDSLVRGADAGCSQAQGKACFSLCRGVAATPAEFGCHGTGAAGELNGTATLSGASTTGCSGTLVAASGSVPLWLHCDTCAVCAERETECSPGDFGTGRFSYAVSTSALTCTKK
jgi:hypothetical protein